MIFNFLPQEFNFYEKFETQINYAVKAADYFRELVLKGVFAESAFKEIHAIEHGGDETAHLIIDQLNKTFITPFDREDIHALVIEIDDIVDMINTMVTRLVVYKITGVNKNLVEFSSLIRDSVYCVSSMVKGMKSVKNSKVISEAYVEVNRLENVGDSLRNKVLAELFEKEKDPIVVIKWKEIYEDAETLLDICEDVSHVIESILVKQA